MKEVILIGDSICMGYFPVVERLLGEGAQLWMPEGGGRTTDYALSHIGEWVSGRRPHVVHINCGLHDLAQDFDAAEPRVPLAEYARNVESILTYINEETGASVVWALTTPVIEAWHHENKGFDRFENNVTLYNEAAGKAAKKTGDPVNDLYSIVMEAGREQLLQRDGVHFKEEGYDLLGRAVADKLKEAYF